MSAVIERSDYRAPWWLPGPHSVTLAAALASRAPTPPSRSERVELPDGDFVDLAWVGEGAPASAPLVLVLHGLEGSVRSPYVRGVLQAIATRGWCGVLLHFRGCSGEPNRLARAYHSGETSDTRALIARLVQAHPGRPLLAVGYSLGGNVLLKYLGEEGDRTPVRAAVAVSVPMMLAPCADRLGRGLSRIYDRWLLRSLVHSTLRKLERVELGHGLTPEVVRQIGSLREFDERVTAPIHGFASADDYYARSSSRPYLSRIVRPTRIVQSRDDPFMTEAVLPEAHELSPTVTLELADEGGHVGFMSGAWPWAPRRWIDTRVVEVLEGLHASRSAAP